MNLHVKIAKSLVEKNPVLMLLFMLFHFTQICAFLTCLFVFMGCYLWFIGAKIHNFSKSQEIRCVFRQIGVFIPCFNNCAKRSEKHVIIPTKNKSKCRCKILFLSKLVDAQFAEDSQRCVYLNLSKSIKKTKCTYFRFLNPSQFQKIMYFCHWFAPK